jgi:hypothetical protein
LHCTKLPLDGAVHTDRSAVSGWSPTVKAKPSIQGQFMWVLCWTDGTTICTLPCTFVFSLTSINSTMPRIHISSAYHISLIPQSALQPLAKRVLHRVLSSAVSSNFQYLPFPQGHPVAVYFFFVVFPSLLSISKYFLQ